MPDYFISFNDGDMQIPDGQWEAVSRDAHAVMKEAIDAGAWVFGGGFFGYSPTVAEANGSVESQSLSPDSAHIGGFAIISASSRDEAHAWAGKIAKACRCAQEVREIMRDPEQELLTLRSESSTKYLPSQE